MDKRKTKKRAEGVAEGLLTALERAVGEMIRAGFNWVILWVFAENSRARRFYEKHGFSLTGKTQTAYGAEEVMYEKRLIREEAAAGRI